MYCRNCGKEIYGTKEYCDTCLAEINGGAGNSSQNNQQTTQPEFKENNTKQKKKCCPRCKSHNLQVLSNTSYESKFSSKSYGAGKGCCGYILFGPIGILCGLCGANSKHTVKSSTSTIWVCLDCGEKFRDVADIDKDIQKHKKNRIQLPIILSIPTMMLLIPTIGMIMDRGLSASILFSAIPGLIFAIWAVWEYMDASSKLDACKKEKQYIENSYINE